MQRAEFAAADLMNEGLPFICNDFGNRILVTGKTGGGKQLFEKGEKFCHIQLCSVSLQWDGGGKGVSDGTDVSEGVDVGVNVDVSVRVGSEVRVGV
jgi:hypothetical protein